MHMARPLKKKDIVLSNEVRLEALPINKSKGRFWRATQKGQTVGEFTTWQQTTYTKQKEGDYGRGGGSYHTAMVRQSWIGYLGETEEKLNEERQFYEWKSLLREIPHPLVKKIA
jgi:hypothetical protein